MCNYVCVCVNFMHDEHVVTMTTLPNHDITLGVIAALTSSVNVGHSGRRVYPKCLQICHLGEGKGNNGR